MAPSSIQPTLPSPEVRQSLRELVLALREEAAALSAQVHPVTAEVVVALLRRVLTYYSSRIEGRDTKPLSIEAAAAGDWSPQLELRDLQEEAMAMVRTLERLPGLLAQSPGVYSPEFVVLLHRSFYEEVPDRLRTYIDASERVQPLQPGALRGHHVVVGRHVAPDPDRVPALLHALNQQYHSVTGMDRTLAAVASHHRMMWIHPFPDGNGRIARLHTQAALTEAGVRGVGLWTLSRGLGRARDAYMRSLANADSPRRGGHDGRGNLSEEALIEFCRFMLTTAIDQVSYMRSVLHFEGVHRRIAAHLDTYEGPHQKGVRASAPLLQELWTAGELTRDQAFQMVSPDTAERQKRDVLAQLVAEGLITRTSPRGPVRLGLPASALRAYFPKLYPDEG
jgi:Fic family protein